jgi:hypothetical protein
MESFPVLYFFLVNAEFKNPIYFVFGVRPLVSLEVLLSVEGLATLLYVTLEWKLGRGLVGPHVLIQIPTGCEGLRQSKNFSSGPMLQSMLMKILDNFKHLIIKSKFLP